MNYLSKAGSENLQYSRRLQECCFLLREKYNFRKRIPLSTFWTDIEGQYFQWNEIPQVRSSLEYDLKRTCLLCGMVPNLNNYLLIFTCAHYGVWRTTRWIQNKFGAEKRHGELQLAAAYKTINYLYSLILSSPNPIKVDPLVDIFIEHKVYKWIEENGWGSTYIEKPSEQNEINKLIFQVSHTFPLEINNIVEAIGEENYGNYNITERRNRETKRNYYFWRGIQRGHTLFEMGMKWEKPTSQDVQDYERALIDDKVSKGVKSYISTHGPLFEDLSTIEMFKHFLMHYSEKEAAERVFEIAAGRLEEILEADIKESLNKHIKN